MALRRRPRLPDDITPEEREARIRELRARRKARMRKLAVRSALGSIAVIVLALVLGWWLLSTIGGRDFLLAQVKARLPAGTELTWSEAEGPVRGPIVLHDLRLVIRGCPAEDGKPVEYPGCRHPRTTTFTAGRLVLDPAIRPLFGRRLRLDALELSDATLDLPDSDEPFELPTWPDALPQVAPPMALQADTIRIDRLKVTRQGAPLVDLRSVRGGLDASEGRVHAAHVVVDSDLGRFSVHGDYAPGDNYRTDLTATAVFPRARGRSPLRGAPPRLGLVARGDLSKMDVGIAGAVPEPLRTTLTLRGAERPRWTLRADTGGLDAALLAGGAPSPTPMVFALRADGIGGEARLQGRFEQGDLRAVVRPSTLKLENQVLSFSPLDLGIFDGRLVVRGSGDFGTAGRDGPDPRARAARIRYAINARGLRFGGTPAATPQDPAPEPVPEIKVDADLGIAGTRAAWAAVGSASITRDGEQATLRLDGRGDAERLRLRTLQARMPTGTLQATGEVAWAPALQWKLDATLDGFDPGYFAPGWEGAVDGRLSSQGRARDAGGLDATARLADLGGRLRGRALSGHAGLTIAGERYDGELLLGVGGGRLEGKGSYVAAPRMQWQAEATLRGFDPGLVLEDWPGAVDADLASTGGRRADGGLDIGIDAQRLGGQLRGRRLSGHAQADLVLPQQGQMRAEGEVAVGMGGSRVEARGRVAGTLDVHARLAPLQLEDFLPGAGGSLRGTLDLGGQRDAPDLAADLTGAGVQFAGYSAESLRAQGRLPWRGSGGELTLRARGLQAGVALDRLRLDARGAMENLQLDGEARGEIGRIALAGSALRRGANWGGAVERLQLDPAIGPGWRLTAPARYAQNGANWTLSRSCFASSEGGSLCVDADWPRRGLGVSGEGLPLALADPYLPEREDGRPWRLNGEIALEAQLRPTANAWAGHARVRSAQGGVRTSQRARRDLIGYRGLALDVEFDPLRIAGTLGTGLSDGGRIDARLATGWDAGAPLTGEIAIDTEELTWLELFSPDIVEPTGRLGGRIALGGTRGAPSLGGQVRLSGFATEIPSLNIGLSEGDVRLQARPDGGARIVGSVRSGDGVLQIGGGLNWRSSDAPLVLNLRGKDFLASDTREVHAVIDPDLTVRVQAGQPLTVTGTVTVPEAVLELERLDDGVSASDDVVVLDPVNPEQEPSSPLALDLTLAMGDDVRLSGFGLKGRLGGRLRVRAVPGREMTGSGALEIDGRYQAYGQELTITRGRLLWSNSAIADPLLDVRAEREIGDVVAGIKVSGRASAPQAEAYSNQGGSQTDALAYLTLGRPLSGLSGDEARDVSAASAALTAGGSVLASQLGERIGLDDAGVMESRTAGSVFGVGKYLSPRVYIGYGVSLLGTGQVVMLKYLLRKGFDVQIESSSVENRGSINWRREK